MVTRDVVVVGASAGGVEALTALVASLPADLPATVLVVLHVPEAGGDALAGILDRSGPLPARPAEHGAPLRHSEVVVARPGHHLLVSDGHVHLSAGPRENGHRPAVDVLFRSAARAVGSRTIAVVLSGALDDGAAGLVAVRQRGGVAVVQDPEEALHAGMPRSAIAAVTPDHVVRAAQLGALLSELVVQVAPQAPPVSRLMHEEDAVARFEAGHRPDGPHPGSPSGYSCPDCAGVLWRIEDGGVLRFRCRVGHAWTSDSLLAQQDAERDSALWMALRGLEERAALNRELGDRAGASGHPLSRARFHQRADEADGAARTLRRMLSEGHAPPSDPVLEA